MDMINELFDRKIMLEEQLSEVIDELVDLRINNKNSNDEKLETRFKSIASLLIEINTTIENEMEDMGFSDEIIKAIIDYNPTKGEGNGF